MTNKITWDEATTNKLLDLVGDTAQAISQATVSAAAQALGTSARSVSAKLRNLKLEVLKASDAVSPWTPELSAQFNELITSNSGTYTYAEIAAQFAGGTFNAKQVQGKVLSMELTQHIRKTEKTAATKSFTDAEEAQFVELSNGGATVEALMEAFGREAAQIRGKALSLMKAGKIAGMPTQETSAAREDVDVLAGLDLPNLTVESIAETISKSVRGVKSMLSRRGISCANHNGAKIRAKLDNAA